MGHQLTPNDTDQAEAGVTYPVLCAWCEKEGRETILGWLRVKGSHGICPAHRADLLRQAGEIRSLQR